MSLDYEVFKNYNPQALTEITFKSFLLRITTHLENVLAFLSIDQSDFIETFVTHLSEKIASKLDSDKKSIKRYKKIISKLPHVAKYPHLRDIALRYLIKQLNLPNTFDVKQHKVKVVLLDTERADNRLMYLVLETMNDIIGRADAIHLFKEFVEYLVKHPRPQEIQDFQDARRSWVEGMANSGGFKFAVHDFDESMFLAKFDRCVVHDSVKDMGDLEFGYLVTCYTGWKVAQGRDWCVSLRRSQTLFSGDFCDELYWDRHVHNEPEQPSLDFSRRLVIE